MTRIYDDNPAGGAGLSSCRWGFRIAFAPASRAKATLGTITPDADQATRYRVTTAGQKNGRPRSRGSESGAWPGLAT